MLDLQDTVQGPHPVIYLTGAPAVGKTTTASLLEELVGARVLSYGSMLTARKLEASTQADLREQSARIITVSDVAELDAQMAAMIRDTAGPCVIDSHAVTKEGWGFRAIPFNPATLNALGITAIVSLYAEDKDILDRIRRHPDGRPLPDLFDIGHHQSLQMSLALSYSHTLGKPAYLIRSAGSPRDTAAKVIEACRLEPE